ncbi:MAG: cytochrome P450 [Sphingobium sp.]
MENTKDWIMLNTIVDPKSLPQLEIDPFDEKVLADPFPFYEHLRELGPIFWVAAYGHYGTARWAPIHHILNTWQDYTATHGVGLSDITQPGNWRDKGALVEEDPPTHTGIRMPMQKIMSAQRIMGWRDALTAQASNLLDEVLGTGDLNAVPTIAETFVMGALPAILGVDANRKALLAIGDHNFNSIGPKNAIFDASAARVEEVALWYQEAAAEGAMEKGGLGEEFFLAEKEGIFAPGLAYKIVRMLLRGGFDTTISGIGSTLYYFAHHPDQYDRVRENPKLIGRAFEEALRLQSPAQNLFRTVNEGVELEGIGLEPGTKIQYWLAAGNRDPRKWDNPDAFDIDRAVSASLAFGGGVHKCIGMMVAKIEAEALFTPFVERVKRVELTGEPHFRLSNSLRTLDALPVRFILE